MTTMAEDQQQQEGQHDDKDTLRSHTAQAESCQEMLALLYEPFPTELDICILDGETMIRVDQNVGIDAHHLPPLARDFRANYAHVRRSICHETSLVEATTCLLLVCPDHSTAWADRRRALFSKAPPQQTPLRAYQAELTFLNFLFTKHSKAPSAWAHRRWICRQFFAGMNKNADYIDEWIHAEIRMCQGVAERFPKNYYSWTHRLFIARMVATNSANQRVSFLRKELQTIEPWLRRHVSDHSAAHYGGQILDLILTTCLPLFQEDDILFYLDVVRKSPMRLLNHSTLASHEVLWIWRRICSHAFMRLAQIESKEAIVASTLHDFVQTELMDVHQHWTDDKCDETSLNMDQQEVGLGRRCARSYMMYVVFQLKRLNLWHWVKDRQDKEEIVDLIHKASDKLANDGMIAHNFWKQSNDLQSFKLERSA